MNIDFNAVLQAFGPTGAAVIAAVIIIIKFVPPSRPAPSDLSVEIGKLANAVENLQKAQDNQTEAFNALALRMAEISGKLSR